MSDYSFLTTWRVGAPIEKVWDAVYHSERWPRWWRAVVRVEPLAPGNGNGIGAISRLTWKGRLPYLLSFDVEVTRIEPLSLLEGRANGELAGLGLWELSSRNGITTVRYHWNVDTTKPWMNLLAPIAHPLFAWNHHVVMRWGGEDLARLLGGELVENS